MMYITNYMDNVPLGTFLFGTFLVYEKQYEFFKLLRFKVKIKI